MLGQDWPLQLPPDSAWTIGVILAAAFAGAFVKGLMTLGLALLAVPLISPFLDGHTRRDSRQ